MKPDEKIKPAETVKIARLKYNGNWDPEPAGWRRLAAVIHNKDRATLAVETVELGKSDLNGFKVAHLTGTQGFKLDLIQRNALKQFITGGGTLVIDAAGGSGEFAQSAEAMIEQLFPEEARQLAEPAPVAHAIYAKGVSKPEDIGYRMFARRQLVGDMKGGRLRLIELEGRPAIVYSREDLSAGLVGQPVDGVLGYDPASATAIMRSIVLSASK